MNLKQIREKMEENAAAEGAHMSRSSHGKLRLIGCALGIIFVALMAFWIAHHN